MLRNVYYNNITLNWRNLLKVFLMTIVIIASLSNFSGEIFASENDSIFKKILIINSSDINHKFNKNNIESIKKELEANGNIKVTAINADSESNFNELYLAEKLKIILNQQPIGFYDLIIAKGNNALQAVYQLGEKLFASVPLVYFDVNIVNKYKYINSTGIINNGLIKENIDLILKSFPETQYIAVITDNSYQGKTSREVIKKQLNLDNRVSGIYINGDELNDYEIIDKINSLPNNSCVFLDSWAVGPRFVYKNNRLLHSILTNLSFPVFSNKRKIIEQGALGGVVQNLNYINNIIFKSIVPDILTGKRKVSEIKVRLHNSATVLNWIVMNKYNGNYTNIKKEAEYLYKSENVKQFPSVPKDKINILYTVVPPLVWKDKDNKLKGILIDIWRLWGKKNNNEISFVELNDKNNFINNKLKKNQIFIGKSKIINNYENYYEQNKVNPLLITTASIYQNSELATEYNWKGYRGKRIAIEKNDSFRKYLINKIPNVTIVVYEDKNTIIEKINSGEFDAFFMEDMVAKTLLKNAGVNQYITSNNFCSTKIKIAPESLSDYKKNPEILRAVLKINKVFDKIPFELIFSIIKRNDDTSAKIFPLFTAEEIFWLNNNNNVRIGCVDNLGVIQKWNDGLVSGIIPDILRNVFDSIGVNYKFFKLSDSSDEFDILSGSIIDALSFSSQKDNSKINYSLPYFSQPVVTLSKDQSHYIGDENSIVVVPSCYMSYYYYIKNKYKDNMVILSSTPENGLKLVEKGIADIVVLDKPNAENFYADIKYNDLYYNIRYDMMLTFSVAVFDTYQNKVFLGIINKGVLTTSDKVINSYIKKHVKENNAELTIQDVISLVGPWFLGLMIFLLGLWGLTTRRALKKLHLSEKNMAKEKAWLTATMHSIGEAVIATDVDGKIVQMNLVAEELIQCDEVYAIGKLTSELYTLFNAEKKVYIDDPVIQVLAKTKAFELKQNLVLINFVRLEVPITLTVTPIIDKASDKVLGAVLVLKDIRDEYKYRKQINQAKTILSNAIELAGVSYFVYDLKINKIIINSGKRESHLYIDKELNLLDILPNIIESDLNKINDLWDNVLRKEITHFRSNYKSKYKGRVRYNRIDVCAELENNKLVRIFGVRLDVTDIVLAENISKERLKQAYDLARLLYYEYQPLTDIVTTSEQLNELFMLKDIDIKAIKFKDLLVNVIEEDKNRLKKYFAQIINNKLEKFELELRILKHSRKRIVKIFASNKFSDEGEWIGTSGCVLDITELNFVQSELEDSEKQKRIILSSIKESVVYISSDLNIVWANESTYKMFGCAEIIPLSEEFNYIIYGEDKPSMLCNTVSVIRGTSEQFIESMSYKGKEMLVSLNPIRDEKGRVTHIVKTYSDVSEFKEIQKNLKEAYERAETANKAKSTFLSTMTHEIRTPLNAIIGFSGLLQYEKLNSKSSSYANSIHTAATGLLSLINNVLDLSRIEADKMTLNLSNVSINELFDEMNVIFDEKARSKNLTLKFKPVESIPPLELDKDRLRQVLINIIGNAIKFTNEGSVTIHAKFKKHQNSEAGTLRVSILDTGIGIPNQDQERMFESFEQHENSSTRRYEGTGLGLGISKRLVELMNGEIILKSEVGIGSEFTIVLRDVVYLSVASVDIDTAPTNIEEYIEESVLLISDNQDDLTIITNMLDKMNLKIETTSSIFDAVEILHEENFGLIITSIFSDNNEVNSIENKLILSAKEKQIPVVALTGYSDPGDFFEVSKYDTVIVKPVTIEVFSETIGAYFVRTETNTNKHKEVEIVKIENVDDLSSDAINGVMERFAESFEVLSHGIVMDEAKILAEEFIEFSNKTNNQLLINIAKNFEQNVATYKLPDIMYIVKQFLKYKDSK